MIEDDYKSMHKIHNSFKVSMTVSDMISVAWKWSKRILREAINAALSDMRIKSCAVMALGLCFTFIGYEYARAASIALLASEEADLGSEALPLTVAIGTPLGGLILYLYTKSIKRSGPHLTLRRSYLFCFSVLLYIAMRAATPHKELSWKVIVVCFYAFREVYVSLLSTQQWAFISTTLDKSTSNYLVSFTGVVSVSSAVGGCTVERLVNIGGVNCLLVCAFISIVAGFACAEYANAVMVDFNNKKAPRKDQTSSIEDSKKHAPHTPKKTGFWSDSWRLIRDHKILQLLFLEGVTHQVCTNMLNIMFHNGLRFSPLASDTKASMVGRFFATVNISACCLQVFVLPAILTQTTLPDVVRRTPVIIIGSLLVGLLHPGLVSVMLGFGSMKVLEYSVMNSASEMIFVSLGHEVRYLGKELIRFFSHKMGKSVASVALSAILTHYQPSLWMQSVWGLAITVVWAGVMYMLADYLQERALLDRSTSSVKLKIPASRSMPLFDIAAEEEMTDRDRSRTPREEPTLVSVSSKNVLFDPDDEDHLGMGVGTDAMTERSPSMNSVDFAQFIEDDLTTNESHPSPYGFYCSGERSRGDSLGDLMLERTQSRVNMNVLQRQSECFSKVPFSNAHEEIVVLQPEPIGSPELRHRMKKVASRDIAPL